LQIPFGIEGGLFPRYREVTNRLFCTQSNMIPIIVVSAVLILFESVMAEEKKMMKAIVMHQILFEKGKKKAFHKSLLSL
jgi:hypothetical protein